MPKNKSALLEHTKLLNHNCATVDKYWCKKVNVLTAQHIRELKMDTLNVRKMRSQKFVREKTTSL